MAQDPRLERFKALACRVQSCQKCARLKNRQAVLGEANGSLRSDLMFIAEAPGRLGADHTGIPLSGDQTGRNFDALLREAQLQRSAIFVTNAVLRNPRDDHGRNTSPTSEEVSNCSEYLAETLDIVQPRIVVALGRKALAALGRIAPHDAQLARDVGKHIDWEGRTLVPLYHPGPRAQRHRSFEQQKEDFLRLGRFFRGSL